MKTDPPSRSPRRPELIRNKGDQALFSKSTQAMKAQWKVPDARPLADFAPTIILKATDLAIEITVFNAREHKMSTEATISREHITNNTAARKTLLARSIRPGELTRGRREEGRAADSLLRTRSHSQTQNLWTRDSPWPRNPPTKRSKP